MDQPECTFPSRLPSRSASGAAEGGRIGRVFTVIESVRARARILGRAGACADNLFNRDRVEREYLPLYANYGLGTTIWSPLASGVLTGKYSGGNVPDGSRLSLKEYQWLRNIKLGKMDQIQKADELKPIAEQLNCTLAQLAIAWCATNPHVSTVILGATSLAQLEENLNALAIVPKLTPEVLASIEAIVLTKPEMDRITSQVTNLRKL